MGYKPTGRPNGRPPKLPPWHRKAIDVELTYAADLEPWPSSASVYQVAAAAGVTPRSIRQRRQCPLYRAEFMRRWNRLLVARLLRAQRRADKAEAEAPRWSWWSEWSRKTWAEADETTRHEWTRVAVKRTWTGPVQSKMDGKIYDTWEAYADHLMAANRMLYDDPADSI